MGEAPSSIIGKLRSLLPLLLMCMVMLGLVMFAVVNIVPHWKTYQELQTQTTEGKKALEALAAQAADSSDAVILKHRIETTQSSLVKDSAIFMSSTQADAILQKLYAYAKDSTVEIKNLQTQNNLDPNAQTADPTARLKQPSGNNAGQAAQTPPDTSSAYGIRAMRITVEGVVPALIRFMTRIKEIGVAGISINNLTIKETDNVASLMMDIFIYTSPLSDGKAYENLPEVVLPPALVVTLEPTVIPTTPTPQTVAPAATAATPDASTNATSSVTIISKDTIPAEPALNPVYTDNFDGGNLDHWKLGAGWILFGEPGAKSLQTTNDSGDVTFAYDTLNNAAVQMRVLMSSNNIKLTFRQSSAGFYGVVLQPTGQIALYRGSVLVKSTTTGQSSIGRWRVLRLSVVNGIIRVAVDGVEVLTARDASELPPGTFAFSAVGRGIIRVDDVQVLSLDSNTPY